MSEQFKLNEKIKFIDLNVKEFWDALDDTQKKDLKKEFFILNRYISSIGKSKWGKHKYPTREEQEHFVLTVNEYYNKNFALLQNDPKLLWLLLCMCNLNEEIY